MTCITLTLFCSTLKRNHRYSEYLFQVMDKIYTIHHHHVFILITTVHSLFTFIFNHWQLIRLVSSRNEINSFSSFLMLIFCLLVQTGLCSHLCRPLNFIVEHLVSGYQTKLGKVDTRSCRNSQSFFLSVYVECVYLTKVIESMNCVHFSFINLDPYAVSIAKILTVGLLI